MGSIAKRPRLLTTSASACRSLWRKSELMGIDMASFEETEALITTLQDIPKKWNVPPAFSVEFIGYFLDRDSRVNRLKKQLSHHAETKCRLTDEQQELQKKYDALTAENNTLIELNNSLKTTIQKYHDIILKVRPNVKLRNVEDFEKVDSLSKKTQYYSEPIRGSVPTAAALKAGVGFPLRLPAMSLKEEKNALELNNKCGICFQSKDQHLLTKCDTCEKYYHLGCLNPPLTRMPKKTKLMGWQCSECDKNSSSSDNEHVDTEAPRKLRRGSKERRDSKNESESSARNSFDAGEPIEIRRIKKHKREKHRLYYPDGIENIQIPVEKHHSRKRKRRSPDNNSEPELEQPRQGIKLFIKSVPNSSGQANFIATQSSTSSTFVAKTEEYVKTPQPVKNAPVATPAPKTRVNKSTELQERCDTCQNIGTNANMVRCDECSKSFHFTCLDPPVKKSPKVRGYSWHCANCDPTETDSD